MVGDLGHKLFFRIGSTLPTAGVVGISSPELVRHAAPF
jgi:hypothetical protein